MSLPFSPDAFFDVFGQYNRALWPGAVTLWVAAALGLAAVALALREARVAGELGEPAFAHWLAAIMVDLAAVAW